MEDGKKSPISYILKHCRRMNPYLWQGEKKKKIKDQFNLMLQGYFTCHSSEIFSAFWLSHWQPTILSPAVCCLS